MNASFRDWACLLPDIVYLMVVKLDQLSDYVHFSGVCPQWRNVAIEANVDHKVNLDVFKASRNKLPMLLFTTDESNTSCKSLYSVCSGKAYDLKLPFPYKHRFLGSSLGWLLCVEKETQAVTLVSPYNKVCISLPAFEDPCRKCRSHKNLFDYYVSKTLLLSDPLVTPDSFVVVILYGYDNKHLAFYKSGEVVWELFDEDEEFILSDIIYYKGRLYGMNKIRHLFEIDIQNKTSKTVIRENDIGSNVVHLVESQGEELLMIERVWERRCLLVSNGETYYNGEPVSMEEYEAILVKEYRARLDGNQVDESEIESERECENEFGIESGTESGIESGSEYGREYGSASDFETESEPESDSTIEAKDWRVNGFPNTNEVHVFKMTYLTEEVPSWVEINTIGQQALFVGDNASVSVSTTEFPGCLPNSIYYTTQHHLQLRPYSCRGPDEDSGIFDLECGKFHTHHMLGSSEEYMQPPIWFVPNLQEIN